MHPRNGVTAADATNQQPGEIEIDYDTTPTVTAVSTITPSESALVALNGSLKYLASYIAPHRVTYQKAIVTISKTILDAFRDVRNCAASIANFTNLFLDTGGPGDPREGRRRAFIPSSLRGTQPINAPEKVVTTAGVQLRTPR